MSRRLIHRAAVPPRHGRDHDEALAQITEDTPAAERERLMREFGLMTEEELAALLKVEVKTLRNRSPAELPPWTKAGAQRMFFKDDVMKFLRHRVTQ